jgi:hypothetical protein
LGAKMTFGKKITLGLAEKVVLESEILDKGIELMV